MKSHIIATTACLALLLGCSSTSNPDPKGTNVEFTGNQGKEFVASLNPTKVSLQRKGEKKKLAANCELTSSKYTASFTTPATVNIPAYSQGAVNATLTCNYNGETYSQIYAPTNLSRKSRNNSAAAVGILLCPICGIGMALGNASKKADRTGDVFGFTELKLEI